MVTRICLVRHGETEWNRLERLQGVEDIELNEAGREQARRCGLFLAREPWKAIVSSPLKRAMETAVIINRSIQINKILEMAEFIERDYGSASGLTPAERKLRFPDGHVCDMETRESVSKRVMDGLQTIHNNYGNHNIIIVAHSAVINAILSILSDGEIGSGKTKLKTACISYIHRHNGQWNIAEYNVTSHLEE